MDLKTADVKRYRRNFLSNVIFRLDYTKLTEYDSTKLKEFHQLIKSDFPILQESPGKMLDFTLDKKTFEAKASDIVKWTFLSKDKTRIASIEFDNITLEFTKYDSFESFFNCIKLIMESLIKVFSNVTSTRLGIRYINQISLDGSKPLEWSDYIEDNLTTPLTFLSSEDKLSRFISSMERIQDSYSIRFQFGIPNSLYPGEVIRKEFVLDYDCYTTEALEAEQVIKKSKEFNDIIAKEFERSIKDKLREEMEIEK